MLVKQNKLFLTALVIASLALPSSAGVAEQNERLKLLIERAKARKASEAAQTNTPAPVSVAPVVTPVTIPIIPVVIPVAAPINPVAVPVITSPSQPTAPVAPSTPNLNERKPRVLETHPKTQTEPVKEAAPEAPTTVIPEPVVEKSEKKKAVKQKPVKVKTAPQKTTVLETKTTVVQPAVQTLITPTTSPIQTKSTTQSSIIQNPSLIKTDSVIDNPTEFKAQPNPGGSSYNDVLNSVDAILKGQEAENKASQKPKNNAPELDSKPVSKKEERKAAVKEPILENKTNPLDNETFTPKNSTDKAASDANAASNPADKDADYLLVLRKSLKSLEEDSWANVKLNMGEALDYFSKEKKLYPNNPKLNTYYKVILGFQRFSEGGLELDEGDFADFEDAEALYLDTQDLLEEVKKELWKDYNGEQTRTIVDTVLKYTEEELQYIEEMLGM